MGGCCVVEQTPLASVVEAIERTTGLGQIRGRQHELKCPAHPDHKPSLGVTENADGHVLMYCQAGCATVDILTAVGLGLRDLYPLKASDRRTDPVIATYRYVDETGTLLFEVLRTVNKRFLQRRPDPTQPGKWVYNLDGVRRVLYRLPAVLQAISEGQTIWLVEGEKDVHTVELDGQVATCNPGGAGKWRSEYTEALRDAHIIVVADIDPSGVGLRHARNLVHQLTPVAASITLVQPAAGKDTTDHRTAGLELDTMTIVGPEIPVGPSAPGVGPTEPVDDTLENIPTSPAEPPVDDRRARIRLTPASAFKIKPVRWVWQDRIPLGELCLIAGREGVGKSTFLAWLAAAVTNGNLPGIYHGEPRAILYSAAEDAWSYTIAPRMQAAGANLDLIYRIDVMEDEGPTGLILPRDSRYLPEIAEETKAAMLMCDPILSLVDDRINPNHGKELRRALEPLKRAAEAAGLAVPALVHFNKTRDVDVLSMFAGSRAWAEVARAALAIARDHNAEDYTCVVSQVKNNLGRLDQPNLTYTIDDTILETEDGPNAHIGRIRWTGESDTDAGEILARKPTHPNQPGEVGDSTAQVLDWIDDQGHGVSTKEIMDHFAGRIKQSNIYAILSRSVQRGHLQRPTSGLYVTSSPSVTESSIPHAGAPTRAREAPCVSVSDRPVPSQTHLQPPLQLVGGGEAVRPDGQPAEPYTYSLTRVDPPLQEPAQVACRACHGPLTPIEPGQLYHPLCEPDT